MDVGRYEARTLPAGASRRSLRYVWPEGLNVALCLSQIGADGVLGWASAARADALAEHNRVVDAPQLCATWEDLLREEGAAALAHHPLPPLARWLQDAYGRYGVPASRIARTSADLAPLFVSASVHRSVWANHFADYLDLQEPILSYWLRAQLAEFTSFAAADSTTVLNAAFDNHTNATGLRGDFAIMWLTADAPQVSRHGAVLLTSTYYLDRPAELADRLVASLQ